MTISREELLQLIMETAGEFNAESDGKIDVLARGEAILFGRGATIDSLGLVRFILATEQAISARYGVEVTISSEQALSQHRSPFRTLGSLADYARELLRAAEV
jgi:hypothetical protein